ncbi:ferredoxin [Kineococcus sp. SYSU DK003]|uniref:ferredoxin n=1 Tax=Kineococcus sp. SYSU DK003 TaxID=3383124 RepID=UPI003D7D5904
MTDVTEGVAEGVTELRIDFAACDGHGACTGLLPELLVADDWGFPRVRSGGRRALVPPELARAAREAQRCCPVLALRVAPRGAGG